MADESGNSPVTPEITMSSGVDLRSQSTGKASSGNGDGKVLPHYLRASTGSCHDFCKYGREHEFKEKERHSIPRRVGRTSLGQSSLESLDGTKKSVMKLRTSLDMKPQISDTSDTRKQNLQSTESQKQVVYEVSVKKTSRVKLRASLDSKLQISDTSENNKNDLQSKPSESQKQVVYEVPVRETSMVNLRASLDSKPHISDTSDANKVDFPSESPEGQNQVINEVLVKKTSGVEQRVSLDPKPRHTNEKEMPTKTPDVQKEAAKELPVKKTTVIKLRASTGSMPQISGTSDAKKQQMTTKSPDSQRQVEKTVPVNRKKASSFKDKPSIHPKSHPSDRPKMMGQKIPTPEKVESLPKLTSFIPTSLKPKSLPVKTKPSNNSSEDSSGQRNGELKMQKSSVSNEPNIRKGPSKVARKKLQTPSRASLSPKPSLNRVSSINARKLRNVKVVSHLKNQSKTRKDEPKQHGSNEVEEKTLYVIKMENENKALESDQNASNDVDSSCSKSFSSCKLLSSSISQSSSQEYQEESEYATSEEEEDSFAVNNEVELKDAETLEVEEKGKPKKDGIVCSEDKDFPMSRLKFRRGKVIETQAEKDSPRSLKFRQGKVLGENANVKAESQKKIFKRRYGAVAATDSTGPEKVFLRHQDVQGKKDAQGLFNNVIEETASKLVETRKSKVKALVGAFETVISLQEKKPTANTTS
ncbi:hypothetical protein L6164_007522 [Bauhinia variegata]|uniref:Uncharacterized protein n=1 Tax=Bauhinia variegata TaxID=167791 RepID=A0ACB9PDT2_BAUVA|nr:hypothetical protein L6164_007522 [Bauhinia variegata]